MNEKEIEADEYYDDDGEKDAYDEIERIRKEAKKQKIKLPKSKSIIVLSWEDIVSRCMNEHPDLTVKDVIEIFERASNKMDDALMEDFWLALDVWIDDHTFEKTEANKS